MKTVGDKMKRVRQKLPTTLIFLAVIFIFIVMSLYKFETGLIKSIEEFTNEKLFEINKQNKERIKLKIKDTFDLMETMALFIGQSDDIFSDEIMENLSKQSKKNSFIRMAVTGVDGIGYTQDGEKLDISDREYFIKGMQGENSITQVLISRIDGKESIILAVPIYRGFQIIGVLRSVYQLEQFTELLEIESIDNTGLTFIIQGDGIAISRPEVLGEEDNFFNFLKTSDMIKEETLSQFKECIKNKESCSLPNYENGKQGALIFERIGINDWYVVSIIEGEIYNEQLDKILKISTMAIIKILIFVGSFIIYILYQVNKGMSEIRINEERYRIISEQSDEIMYEYDIANDSMDFSPKWKEKFGYHLSEKDFFYKVKKNQFIYREDAEGLIQLFKSLMDKEDYAEMELRILNIEGVPRWCRLRANAVYNRRNVIVKIFGEIVDIDNEKNQREDLIEAASRDALTNLYNTSTVNRMVQEYLKERKKEEACAVVYIDVDDFKDVNDTYGHLFGDEVLRRVAFALTEVLKGNTIVGRIGGDEFFMFIKNLQVDKVDEVAEDICNSIRNIRMEEDTYFYLTVSVGMAICPQDGQTRLELYEHADQALYQAKLEGKDRYKIFGD